MIFKKRRPPTGSRPGTLVVSPDASPPRVRVMSYGKTSLQEQDDVDAAGLRGLCGPDMVTWIDVRGHGDVVILQAIAGEFSIHALALEDVTHVPQRPKVEAYAEHQHIVTRMLRLANGGEFDSEQVSMFLGSNYVLTFQEREGDVFDPVRKRIRRGGGRMRQHGADYLAYALLDAVIDGYYPVVERLGEELEAIEEQAVDAVGPQVVRAIQDVKRKLLAIRRSVWPLREALNTLVREEDGAFSDRVRVYLRDCQDHCIQLLDVVETYREIAGGLMELYLSSVGHRQNEIMKILTIMASIFIPLTFMAGIYGMNFAHMPELQVPWAYPALLVLMALAALGMVLFFRQRGWIGRGQDGED